jgi:ArsR family transcriptional regulator, arsenate/arsenite/antimonite-responsive transcriptional repressor
MSDVFDVLADSTRRDIVDLLRSGSEMSVGQLVDSLGITQPTVSKHLKVLRDAGIVVVREEGQHRYYRFDEVSLSGVRSWVGGSLSGHPAAQKPFFDLREPGVAVGSIAKDLMAFLDDVVAKVRR